ncbi:hypothetical protein [Brevundimonas sp. FT23042]|uniref:hypothetical protein n=1 Tax=Brevundimonas sp. FT23042 TaxID=3393749 RepID=UPI003B586335
MRASMIFAPVLMSLALAACSTGGGANSYVAQERQLAADCEARGGILSPTGSQSGRPQLDNVCEIRGGTARAPGG